MFFFVSNTGLQPWPPLLDGLINDTLFQLRPDGDEALFQIIDVPYRCLVDYFLSQTPDSVVIWVKAWRVCLLAIGPVQ